MGTPVGVMIEFILERAYYYSSIILMLIAYGVAFMYDPLATSLVGVGVTGAACLELRKRLRIKRLIEQMLDEGRDYASDGEYEVHLDTYEFEDDKDEKDGKE